MGYSIHARWTVAVAIAACFTAGCEVSKTENPLSPSVAGPIAGVSIGTPDALQPCMDCPVKLRDQPLRLVLGNVGSTGQRPLTYTFELASDDVYTNVVFKRTGIAPGADGQTSVQLPDVLPSGRTYWWHARADDGANTSPYSVSVRFNTITPVVLGTPKLEAPIGTISTTAPDFSITSGSTSGPAGKIIYMVQVANDPSFTSIAATFVPDQGGLLTIISTGYQFLNNKTYYWRAQARDTGESQATSDWSTTQAFTTAYASPAPPSGGGGGGGGLGGGNWQACGSTPGYDLVDCVRNAVYTQSTLENAFDVTKRVAWLLRGQGYGLLQKIGGENVINWQGASLSISRVCHPSGYPVKVLSDAGPGGTNGSAWGPDPSDNVCVANFIPAKNPDLP